MDHDDAVVITFIGGTGIVAQSRTDVYILDKALAGPSFEASNFTHGQKIRIVFDGLREDGQPKIKNVLTLS